MATATKTPATEKQMAFLLRLIDERRLGADAEADANGRAALQETLQEHNLSKSEASNMIEHLLEQPYRVTKKQPPQQDLPDVPAGRYAIFYGEQFGSKFYQVDRPEQGRWAGYVFVSELHGDNRKAIRDANARREVLEAIAETGARQAAEAYGRQVGICGICHRTLTDPVSVERGIGPVCAGKMGW